MNLLHRIFLCGLMTVAALSCVGLLTAAPRVTQAASAGSTTPIQLTTATGTGYGLDDVTTADSGLPTTDLKVTVLHTIRWVLTFLGVIGVILVVYAGFLWMTAAGNDEQIKKAKGIITAAIIGMVIIILAFAIVQFILNGINAGTAG